MLFGFFFVLFFFFKQKTAYEMRISDWSSDVCSSDLIVQRLGGFLKVVDDQPQVDAVLELPQGAEGEIVSLPAQRPDQLLKPGDLADVAVPDRRPALILQHAHVLRDRPARIQPQALDSSCNAHGPIPFADRKSTRLNSSH